MTHPQFSRRDFMIASAAVAGAGLASGSSIEKPVANGLVQPANTGQTVAKRAIRIAHMTDTHIQPEERAGQGVGAAFEHVMAQSDRPELILTGGDHVMDAWAQTDERTKEQFGLWHKVYKDHCTIPMKACIGNHDLWAINREKSKVSGNEPNLGKQRAIDELGIPHRYYAFTQAGWKFIVLDSVTPTSPDGYQGGLDTEQFEWLKGELQQTSAKQPVLILTHIPILHASSLLVKDDNKPRQLARGKIYMDALSVVDLFQKYPNVKVVLGGHIHIVERLELLGITFLCNGAVSGNWWKNRSQEERAKIDLEAPPRIERSRPGYAMVDLFEDGTFANQYVDYGW